MQILSFLVFCIVLLLLCLSSSCTLCAQYYQCLWTVHCSMLPVSLDCPLLNVTSVSGLSIAQCYQCLWTVHCSMLPVSLDCPLLNVTSVSGLSIAQCCQCLWTVHSFFPLHFSLTFILYIFKVF